MNFSEKKEAYQSLQDPAHLEPDRELLTRKAPHAPALKTGMVDKEKSQCEILWDLLDHASEEEITANRTPVIQFVAKVNEAYEKAIIKLAETDLETATQPQLAALARSLKIETTDYKLATLRPLLFKFLTDLKDLKDLTANPQSHSDQVIDLMNAEKEELHEKVGELETENEDLQSQLEDSESEKQDLEEQLEEEKKSEATPDLQ